MPSGDWKKKMQKVYLSELSNYFRLLRMTSISTNSSEENIILSFFS